MLESDGRSTLTSSVTIISSPSTIPPPNHHPHLPSSRRRTVAGVRFRVPSGDTALSNFDQKPKKRAPAYRSSVNSPDGGKPFEVSRQWWCWRLFFFFFFFFFFVGDFFKKSRKLFSKKRKVKKKSGIPLKSGRLTSLIHVGNVISTCSPLGLHPDNRHSLPSSPCSGGPGRRAS